jgi:hypothetical protein
MNTEKLAEVIAQALRDHICEGDCGETEEECEDKRIQPVAWQNGILTYVMGTPEVLAAVAVTAVTSLENQRPGELHPVQMRGAEPDMPPSATEVLKGGRRIDVQNIVLAPWTPQQVVALNRFQHRPDTHPFTCGGDHSHEAPTLVAREDGWYCPSPYGQPCDYRQNWAHAFMTKEQQ